MHRSWTVRFFFTGLGVLMVCAVLLALPDPVHAPESTPTRPANCAPLPVLVTATRDGRPPTATPDRFATPRPEDGLPTPTPIVFANIVDLSPEMPQEEKWHMIVLRCDGSRDLYAAGPDVDIYEHIHLEAGDVILNHEPPMPSRHAAPEPP